MLSMSIKECEGANSTGIWRAPVCAAGSRAEVAGEDGLEDASFGGETRLDFG
jgi:hypothetical protein